MLEIGLILTVQDIAGPVDPLKWKLFFPGQRKLRLLITSQDSVHCQEEHFSSADCPLKAKYK